MTTIDSDMLVSQIVTDDDEQAWMELADRARTDPVLWRRLAESYRDQVRIAQLLEVAGDHAEQVVADAAPHRLPRASAWAGWAAAAVLLLAWTTGLLGPRHGENGNAQMAGIGAITVASPKDALDAYLDLGKSNNLVIGEMPTKVVLETRPSPSGEGLEVTFIRRLVERQIVDDLFEIGETTTPEEADTTPPLLRGRM